jgi:hypothetical protein
MILLPCLKNEEAIKEGILKDAKKHLKPKFKGTPEECIKWMMENPNEKISFITRSLTN